MNLIQNLFVLVLKHWPAVLAIASIACAGYAVFTLGIFVGRFCALSGIRNEDQPADRVSNLKCDGNDGAVDSSI